MLDFIWLLTAGLVGLYVGYAIVSLINLFKDNEDL